MVFISSYKILANSRQEGNNGWVFFYSSYNILVNSLEEGTEGEFIRSYIVLLVPICQIRDYFCYQ